MTVNISRRSNVECFSRNSLACGARLVPFYLSDRVQSADQTGTRARRLLSVGAASCTSPNLDLFKPIPDRSCADEMAKPLYGQHPVRALLALRHVLLDFRPRWILTQSTILVAFKIVSRNVSQVSRPSAQMRRTLSYPLTPESRYWMDQLSSTGQAQTSESNPEPEQPRAVWHFIWLSLASRRTRR